MTHSVAHQSHSSRLSHTAPHGPVSEEQRHAQLTDQAQKWIAQTFYGTLLKQMRDDPFKSEMIDGGRGGQVFSEMFDQRMAEHMARSSGSKLVNSLVRKMEGSEAYRKQAKASARRGRAPSTPSFTPPSLFSGKA